MTNQNSGTPATPFLPSLGGGRIIADTFSIYLGGFFRIFPIGLAILFASNALVYLIYGDLGQNLYDETGSFRFGKMILANGIVTAGYSIFMSLVVLAALDFKNGRPNRIGGYLQIAIANILPIIILQFAYGIGIGLGIVLLIVPGFYLMAMWSVYIPAILIEQAGFGGLTRSMNLTQNYRWSILGPLIVLFVIAYFIIIISLFISMGSFAAMITPEIANVSWMAVITQTLGTALGSAFLAVGSLVIFNRLKEIKEGGGVTSEFAEVFD